MTLFWSVTERMAPDVLQYTDLISSKFGYLEFQHSLAANVVSGYYIMFGLLELLVKIWSLASNFFLEEFILCHQQLRHTAAHLYYFAVCIHPYDISHSAFSSIFICGSYFRSNIH